MRDFFEIYVPMEQPKETTDNKAIMQPMVDKSETESGEEIKTPTPTSETTPTFNKDEFKKELLEEVSKIFKPTETIDDVEGGDVNGN